MEQVARLEAILKRKETIRRIVIAAITVVMIALGITFASLREASREVIVNEIYGVKWETVTYNEGYTPWIAVCFSFGIVSSSLFVCDLLLCRFETLPVNGSYITVYRGAIESVVYVNGEEEKAVRQVLSAAALTYVAAAVTSLLSLLRLVMIANRRRN